MWNAKMFLRLEGSSQAVSEKQVSRSREKSAFIKAVIELGLKVGEYAYVSHKEWLTQGGEKQSVASQKNGPRYSLKAQGFTCRAVLLSGEDLQAVSDGENRELSENDVIYSITKSEE